MCRHAGYIGPSVAIDALTHTQPHDLLHQSYQARELLTGSVCADGYGVVWYNQDVRAEPGRYAYEKPIWSDASFPDFAPLVSSQLMLAAVRNATIAGHNTPANCAPFVRENLSFSHNGFLTDLASWGNFFAENQLVPASGNTDSEALFGCLAGPLVEGLQQLCINLKAYATEHNLMAQLNFLASDGTTLVATRAGTDGNQNSLYHLQDGVDYPGAHVVASEPLSDDDWQPVGEDTLLVLQAGAPPVRLRI